MAFQISGGLTQPAANSIAAHNLTHKSQAAEEIAASTKPHYDGSEVDGSAVPGVEQVLSSFYSAPATFAEAILVAEKAILLWDTQHTNRHNAAVGAVAGVFAHLTAGTLIGGTVGPTGATLEAAMIAAWGPITIELLTTLRNHMLNTGGVWHLTADTFNSVGTIPAVITTPADLCAWIIVLRSVYEAHRVYGVGVQHTISDVVNTVTSEPPDNSDDWGGMLAVLIEVADELEDHVEDGAYHNAVMAVTPSVAAYPSSVSDAFTRINLYKSTHNADLANISIHVSADGTNLIGAANATSVPTYLTLAQEIYTDQTAHFRFAPISAAQRGV